MAAIASIKASVSGLAGADSTTSTAHWSVDKTRCTTRSSSIATACWDSARFAWTHHAFISFPPEHACVHNTAQYAAAGTQFDV